MGFNADKEELLKRKAVFPELPSSDNSLFVRLKNLNKDDAIESEWMKWNRKDEDVGARPSLEVGVKFSF